MPIIKDLSALQSWVDHVTLRGFSMSPPLQIGNEFMLGLCLGSDPSECTCVHMSLDRLQEVTGILFGDRERRVYIHALKETMLWFKRQGIDLPADMFLDVSLAAYLLNPPERDQNENWRKFQLSSLVREYLKEPYPFVYKRVAGQDYPEALYGQLVQDAHYVWRLRPLIDQILADETLLQPYWELEIMLTPVLADMELRGVGLSKQRMSKALPRVEKALGVLGRQLESLYGKPFDAQSNTDVKNFLRHTCGVRLGKDEKIDNDLLKGLARSYVPARKLRQWRRLHETKEFLDKHAGQDRCYPKWWLTRTAVGRIVCTDPALQSLPRYVRHYLEPGTGGVFIKADYSAFQLRLLAHLSQDSVLVGACAPGRRPHDETRDLLLKKGINVTRAQAKTVNFSICYGGTAWSLKDNLGLGFTGLKLAQQILTEMKQIYPGLFAYLEGVKETLESSPEGERYVRSIRGRRRGFSHPGDLTEREKRQAANAVVQMLEADVFKKTVLELDKAFKREGLPVKIVLLLHDGIWFTCPEEYLQQAKMLIEQVMENSVSLSVPLKVDFE